MVRYGATVRLLLVPLPSAYKGSQICPCSMQECIRRKGSAGEVPKWKSEALDAHKLRNGQQDTEIEHISRIFIFLRRNNYKGLCSLVRWRQGDSIFDLEAIS
jgi:hypothetical protein